MERARFPLWPRSLKGQLLLAIALALLLAQGISAGLRWRAQDERREMGAVHAAALRFVAAAQPFQPIEGRFDEAPFGPPHRAMFHGVEVANASPALPGEARVSDAEAELRRILAGDINPAEVVVVRRRMLTEPGAVRHFAERAARGERRRPMPDTVLIAALHLSGPDRWLIVRQPESRLDRSFVIGLIGQTLLLYALLVGAIALILNRMTRPLAALTSRVEQFAQTRDVQGQIAPQGPDDVRRLIVAHNAMEDRIAALLDEKDVMLGAIGHDLKTPLAALRVRIESVDDDAERSKMAATIEDITRSLDDILSLARVGRPSDPLEPTELSALIGQITEEFEDMGEPVSFDPAERIVLPLRTTWARRAVRNLVVNALRYGKSARIAIVRTDRDALIRIEDDGPGIPEDRIGAMLEPFTRGEPSRNSATGGAGLGLTLARAIAEQHGGKLILANRHGDDGVVAGLTATLALPLS